MLKATAESELKESGATFSIEEDGFTLQADAAGARALYQLRARHVAARDRFVEILRQCREDGTHYSFQEMQEGREVLVEAALARTAKRARAEESLASTYDRALRKMEQLDSTLVVEHVDLTEEGLQMLEDSDKSNLRLMFDAR